MKKIFYMFALILTTLSLSLTLLATPVFAVTAKESVCEGVNSAVSTNGSTDCSDNSGGPNIDSIIKTVVNLLSLVVGIAAVIMVIIGGLKYILSSGDSANVSSAKNTILYAIIGLVIVALAQIIVRFVIKKVS